ncbi:MAG: hypothetical protein JWR52_2655 [Marmoricola sp.]|nr:hypothetical protein [Marmoricola sp.]
MAGRARRPRPCGAEPYVGELILVAFAGMTMQVVAMGYGENLLGPPTFWILIEFALLMLVQVRRSEIARGLVIVTATAGAILHAPGVSNADAVNVLFVAFIIQALALAAPPVRRHVRTPRLRGPTAAS